VDIAHCSRVSVGCSGARRERRDERVFTTFESAAVATAIRLQVRRASLVIAISRRAFLPDFIHISTWLRRVLSVRIMLISLTAKELYRTLGRRMRTREHSPILAFHALTRLESNRHHPRAPAKTVGSLVSDVRWGCRRRARKKKANKPRRIAVGSGSGVGGLVAAYWPSCRAGIP
jgi:hypothetical protein